MNNKTTNFSNYTNVLFRFAMLRRKDQSLVRRTESSPQGIRIIREIRSSLKRSHVSRTARIAIYFSFFIFHFSFSSSFAQPTASDGLRPSPLGATDVVFSTVAEGEQLPIVWGMDAAWISPDNVKRGMAFIGRDNLSVLRVSFQPTEPLVGDSALTTRQRQDLNRRLAVARLMAHPDLVVNSDPADGKVDPYFTSSSGKANAARWARLIDISTRAYEDAGYRVITVSPFNEPDYGWGQGTISDFRAICQLLRTDYADHFHDIRISAGNTLNCDCASEWYNYMKPYVDEGCTHQLAGAFNTYADFFAEVRADGLYATADELHNVMEAMVGVQYGMQTGIWWGFDGLARGQFCRASFGRRLAYAENRSAWAAASVYRNTLDDRLEAFLGTSERQAKPSSWRFVVTDRPVYFDGYGPTREFSIDMPGGNGYQQGQTNAERMLAITWGDDVPPAPVDGTYMVVNRGSRMVLSLQGGQAAAGTRLVQLSWTNRPTQQWHVRPVDARIGGDFSYHTICSAQNGFPIDVWNWSLDAGGEVRLYNGSLGTNEQWYLQYAGDGFYFIRSRHSNLCLEVSGGSKASGASVQQGTFTADDRQQWKLIPVTARCKLTPPDAPAGLTATPQGASVLLRWQPNAEPDIAGYHVLRADAATGQWNTIARCVPDTLFVDNTVSPRATYRYKVRAVDASTNVSDASAEAVSAGGDGSRALVARYAFDQTLRDTTANAFHAVTSYDAPLYTAATRYVASGSHSLRLDGNGFLQLPPDLFATPALTLSLWICWMGSTAGAGQRILDVGYDARHSFYLTPSDGSHMRFAIASGDDEQTLLAPKLSPLKLHHVALTIGADSVALYVDGEPVAATADVTLRPSDLPPVLAYIGRGQQSSQTLLRAYLDDVRVYNYPLTADEVRQVMTDVDTSIQSPRLPQAGGGAAGDGAGDGEGGEGGRGGAAAYDLQGRPVAQPAHGLYLRNGRKYYVR